LAHIDFSDLGWSPFVSPVSAEEGPQEVGSGFLLVAASPGAEGLHEGRAGRDDLEGGAAVGVGRHDVVPELPRDAEVGPEPHFETPVANLLQAISARSPGDVARCVGDLGALQEVVVESFDHQVHFALLGCGGMRQ
jgi:hypothetical protein